MSSTNEENELSILLKEFNKEIKAKTKILFWLEGTTIFVLMGLLVVAFLVPSIREFELLKIRSWLGVVFGLVILVGRLVSCSIVRFLLRILDLNRCCRIQLKFYAIVVKGTLHKSIWAVIVFLVWHFFLYLSVETITKSIKSQYLMVSLSVLVGGYFVWLVMPILLKVHEKKSYVRNYFDRVRKSVIEQYVIEMLLSPPQHPNIETSKINDLGKLNRKSVTAHLMETMLNMIRHKSLPSTEELGHADKPTEEAVTTEILQNSIESGSSSTLLENTRTFLFEQSAITINFFEGDQINKENLCLWVVTVYGDRQTLLSDFRDTTTTLKKYHQVVKIVMGVLIVNTCLLLMSFDKLQASVLAGIEVLVGVCWSLYGPST